MGKICVFCGSSAGNSPEYMAAARELGRSLAENETTLVFGGSNIGLMGEIAKTVMEHGGYAIGIIPRKIYEMVTHMPLSEEHIVNDMHERKAMMYRLADGFIVLPGGLGTMEEFFEAFTWNQLGYHLKPVGILDINHYFAQLRGFLEHMVGEGFCKREHLETLIVEGEPKLLLDKLQMQEVKYIDKLK